MIGSSQTLRNLQRLLQALPRRRRRTLLALLPLAILSGVIDLLVVGLAARLFTLVVGEPNRPPLPWPDLVPEDPRQRMIGLVLLFIAASWLASLTKLSLRGGQIRLKARIWRDLSETIHHRLLAQPYSYFLGQDGSDLSTRVLLILNRVSDFLVMPVLRLISAMFVIILLCAGVLAVGKLVAMVLIIALVIAYLAFTAAITPFLRLAARHRLAMESKSGNILSESIRTIVDLHLTGSEAFFERRYSEAGQSATPYIWKAELLPELPRALIEPFGITLIFTIGMLPLLATDNAAEMATIVPFLATVAIASLKLTPPLQECFHAVTYLRAGLPDLDELLRFVDLPQDRLTVRSPQVPTPQGVMPSHSVHLNKVSYQYPNSDRLVLQDITLTIPIGSRVALVGATGSGKSTTANLLLGLLSPSAGSLQLDGMDVSAVEIPAWQANCAYVPQAITLLNSNVIENVAYGQERDAICEDQVWDALRAARLADLVRDLPAGLHTLVGENGIRLSGGQRQRLALARAFYRKAGFLVLDEATSALDNRTESEVLDAMDVIGRRCTLVVIAHRLSTVIRSDCIYEFAAGRIKASGTFEQLRQRSDSFQDLASFENQALRE